MNNNPGTLNKVLSGINNTLTIANKALPIIKETKPLMNNVSKTYQTFKNSGKDFQKMMKLIKVKNQIKKDINEQLSKTPSIKFLSTYSNTNNPKFFI